MKKFLPLIILLLGIVIVVGAFVFTKVRKGAQDITPENEEEALIDVPLENRPVVVLTPREDGHWLDMTIEKLEIDAATIDYELLYTLPDGRVQGVPGTQRLEGKDSLQIELLLGSESSGKFRYDEGVETGSMTLKFRNDKGKLVAKFKSDFTLKTGEDRLVSPDGKVQFELDAPSEEYFVVMNTVGYPDGLDSVPDSEPYGVFTSDKTLPEAVSYGGSFSYAWDGKSWNLLGATDKPLTLPTILVVTEVNI